MKIVNGELLYVIDSDIVNGTFNKWEGITSIGEKAFYKLETLYEINIPSGIEVINDTAFGKCSNLKKITIGEDVKKIGAWAFRECRNIESIVLPKGLKSIGESAFQNCAHLKNITLPSSLESIGRDIVVYCSDLEEVIIDNKKTNIKDYEKIILDNINLSGRVSYYKKKSALLKVLLYADKYDLDNYKITYPEFFINKLSKEEVKTVFKYDSVKHFKEIYKNYEFLLKMADGYDASALYLLAYFLGCFADEEAIIGGHKYNIAQKMSGYFKTILDKKILTIEMCHSLFRNLEIKKYNIDFIKFLTDSPDNFVYLLSKRNALIRIINDFDIIMHGQIITDSKGRVLKQTSVKNKIENYLLVNSYEGIKEGNEDIAKEFLKFTMIHQTHFDEAQQIREKSKNIPSHILNKPLKESNIMETIESLQSKIEKGSVDSKKILDELYEKEFTYEWLDKHDPKNFILGIYCNCCASILNTNYGRSITEASIINEKFQNLVIKNKEGLIVAKATAYVNKEKGYVVFNDIEMNKDYGNESNENDYSDNKQRIKIYKAFKRGVNDFVEEYNKNNEVPIMQVNVGWGFNKLKQVIRMFEQESLSKLEVPFYFGDAYHQQWVVFKKK